MAGIWDRVIPGNDRLSVHQVTAAIALAVNGTFTDVQIRNTLNSKLTVPLDAAAVADLAAIRANIAAMSAANRGFGLHLLESVNLFVEEGNLTNEATYRSVLNIA